MQSTHIITCVQIEVYENSVLPVIDSFLEGYNATVLAYGQASIYAYTYNIYIDNNQTGSGKTFTMGTGLEVSQDDQNTQGK